MRAIRGIVAPLVACALAFTHLAVAATPAERGRDWLAGQVGANGALASEAASVALPLESRAESLHALSLFSAAPSALADAVAQYDAAGKRIDLAARDLALNREVVKNRRDFTTAYEYDSQGNVTRIVDARNKVPRPTVR